MLLPLLSCAQFDEYTTTHSLNVSVLTMALAESIELGARDVRAFGVAGLLHDLGKVRIPLEILNKPGKLTDEERAVMQSHTVDGARHHHHERPRARSRRGGGVRAPHHARRLRLPALATIAATATRASKLVHVCDVYDALRTNRPYRDAWDADRVLDYVEKRAGVDFEPAIAAAFVGMMRRLEHRVQRGPRVYGATRL